MTSAELDQEITRHALQHGAQPQDIARTLKEQGTVGVLVADVLRRKALEALVGAAEVEDAPPRELLVELGLAPADEAETSGEEPGSQAHEPSLGEEQPPAGVAVEEQGGPEEAVKT